MKSIFCVPKHVLVDNTSVLQSYSSSGNINRGSLRSLLSTLESYSLVVELYYATRMVKLLLYSLVATATL